MDDTYSALFDLAEEVGAEVVSSWSNLGVAMQLDNTAQNPPPSRAERHSAGPAEA